MANTRELSLILRLKDELSKELQGISKSIDGMQPTFQKMAVIGTAAFAGLSIGLKSSIKEASDLNESINAVNVVFKDGADVILSFGENSAKAVGLATSEFNQMSTVTGALLKDLGIPMNEVSNLTIDLTKRAADMASVFNTDVSDAMTAINAAIRGETEPIRRFAVDVSDASIKSYLLAQGIEASVTEMTQQDKKMYRTKMIFEQTKDTMNDFTNTSGEMANQQRILNAEFKNAAAELGKSFLPIIKEIQAAILPIITKIGEWTQKNPELARNIVLVTLVVTGLIAVIGFLGIALGGLATVTATLGISLLALFGWIVAIPIAIAAVIAAGVYLYQNWDMIVVKAGELWESLVSAWDGILQSVSTLIESIGQWFDELPGRIAYGLGFALTKMVLWGIDMYNYIMDNIPVWIENIKNFFLTLPSKIWGSLVGAYNSIVAWGSDIYNYLSKKIPQLVEDIVGWFKSLPSKMTTIGSNLVDGLMKGISDSWGRLTGWMGKMLDKFKDGVKDALGVHSPSKVMAEIGKNITDGLIIGIQSGANKLSGVVDGISSTVTMSGQSSISAPVGSFGSGGGTTIVVNVTGNTLLDNNAAIKIGDMIVNRLKLNYQQ